MMRISFVLPSRSPVPIGAFRVVYELANRLVEHDNRVAIVHPRTKRAPVSLLSRVKAGLWVQRYSRDSQALAPWFEVDPRVRLLPVTHLNAEFLPDADALVAVTWETPHCVAEASASKGRGYYLIQEGVPFPFATVEDVKAAWQLPLHKIVISGWLEEIAVERGEGDLASRVPIGVDLDAWGVDVPIERRGPRVGGQLNPIKGEEEILAALSPCPRRGS